ncbi:hypothetical protein JAAARDRAFT_201358 [Jaapia argillacea MUCL 33604]|uniref:Uncharacterized protein n=1 Tax=Jaapia argillacea MUCL 33604 TaxID=933084 RepID=A0A067P1T1_9AGAM|nr:hypothetical protein JAAARDRAFT_201358 [Jaapia argillacea MUCL 33604]
MALAHAVSPSLYPDVSIDVVMGSVEDTPSRAACVTALGFLDEFPTVIGIIPLSYREALRGPLKNLYNLSNKLGDVSSLVHKLKLHEELGTWPTQTLGIHILVLQVFKEYLATVPNACQVLQAVDEEYRKATRSRSLAIKQAEEQWILQALSPILHAVIEVEGQRLSERYKHPRFTPQENGTLELTLWMIDPIFADKRIRLLNDVTHFSICVMEIS